MNTVYGLSRAEMESGHYRLKATTYSNATIYPWHFPNIGKGAKCGAFDEEECFIEDSAVVRMNGAVTDIPEVIPGEEVDTLEIEAIYGGCFVNHFGHFLLESLARLWFAAQKNMPIVWSSGTKLNLFQEKIFDLLEIDSSRMIFLSKPTTVKCLHIPTPGFIIQNTFHRDHAEFLGRFPQQSMSKRKVYFTRTSFKSKIAEIAREQEMEDILRRDGWEVISPEKLDILEQLKILASAQCVAAIEGSAVHSVVLCEKPAGRLVLLRRNPPSRNYNTIANTKGLDQVDIFQEIFPVTDDRKILEISSPAHSAQAIIAASL